MSIGGIGAWLASTVEWIDQFGAFGWYVAGLVCVLIAVLAGLSVAGLRYLWIRAGATRKWQYEVHDINPLAKEFHKQRIKFLDLAHPITKSISGKRIVDCELMGPANLFMKGKGGITGANLNNCDVVVVQSHKAVPINNVVVIEDTDIIGGDVWECTIFISIAMVPIFQGMGAEFITLTGHPDIDTPQQQGT